jgi:phosphoribulokinase
MFRPPSATGLGGDSGEERLGAKPRLMSVKHPVIAITGSSGAGTTTVKGTFEQIFRRMNVSAAVVEGDAYHRYDRTEMRDMIAAAKEAGRNFSHFGPEANLFEELEDLFRIYGETGGGKSRSYLHDDVEAEPYGQEPGTFTPWRELPPGTDVLFYEGLHGAVATDTVDVARWADLLIGVVPSINLEWIQKLYRDRTARRHTQEAIVETILRRMPDYINYITPQFSRTHINFQRVPLVDTSNPFIARTIPTLDESMLVVRFRDSRGVDFPYLLAMLHDSFMSRPNTIVCPGGKMELAMQLIFTPIIEELMRRKAGAS